MGYGKIDIDFETDFAIEIRLMFKRKYGHSSTKFQVYVTTYENSYGLTMRKWFDGKVDQNMIPLYRQK